MQKTCPVCNHILGSKRCTNCNFTISDGEITVDILYENQIMIAQSLYKIKQQGEGLVNKHKVRQPKSKMTILAGIVQPVKVVAEKVNIQIHLVKFITYIKDKVGYDLGSMVDQINRVPAIRLAAQKKILKGNYSSNILRSSFSYIPFQELLERQKQLFQNLLEEQKHKIKEEAKKEQKKSSGNSKSI